MSGAWNSPRFKFGGRPGRAVPGRAVNMYLDAGGTRDLPDPVATGEIENVGAGQDGAPQLGQGEWLPQ